MRMVVADVVVRALQSCKLSYPTLDADDRADMAEMHQRLLAEKG